MDEISPTLQFLLWPLLRTRSVLPCLSFSDAGKAVTAGSFAEQPASCTGSLR